MMTNNNVIVGTPQHGNPFEITKAVHFTDSEINKTWVDWPAPGGFAQLMNVISPMPRIVRGGKGTGRTHFMRYFSAPVQAIRGGEDPIAQVLQDGVLGVYVLCGGLNSSRFRGRGNSPEIWQSVFSQYADLWLAQAALIGFNIVTSGDPPSVDVQRAITQDVRELLHSTVVGSGATITDLIKDLFGIQRRIDLAVNNAVLNRDEPLDITIQSTPGTLVFGVPNALRRHYQPLRDIQYLYLIDELENFEEPQQQYVNSLVREKETGTSFMIGVRTYGLHTYTTLNGSEENKHGSEFEEFRPDRNYIGPDRDKFENFCRRVVARRLTEYDLMEEVAPDMLRARLREFFQETPPDYEEQEVIKRYRPSERPYLKRLERDLLSLEKGPKRTPITPEDVDVIIQAARVPSRPLLEKVNVFLIYRAWATGEDLVKTAAEMIDARFSADPSVVAQPNTAQQSVLLHYTTDLKAQLCHDMRLGVVYAGIDQFITMSDGLPRNLLVILKNIYRWAVFNGEQPFQGGAISLESQRLGVREASEWFFADARPLGEDGEYVRDAISRLGDMFRRFRFSNKPVESSLATFSADLTKCSPRAQEIVKLAEQWALLVEVDGGQKQRNTRLTESKFQLNRLLSPKWDLPTARRGAIALRADEVNAIFDPDEAGQFRSVVNRRLQRMDAPFNEGRRQNALQTALDLDCW